MDTWQRSHVPPEMFCVSTVFPLFQHGTATTLHTCTGFSLILYYIRRFKKKKTWIRNIHGLHVPTFKLNRNRQLHQVLYQIPLRFQSYTWSRSGNVAKTKRCRHTNTPNSIAQFWTCTVCFRRIKINIIKEDQLKTESRRAASVNGPRSAHTIYTT